MSLLRFPRDFPRCCRLVGVPLRPRARMRSRHRRPVVAFRAAFCESNMFVKRVAASPGTPISAVTRHPPRDATTTASDFRARQRIDLRPVRSRPNHRNDRRHPRLLDGFRPSAFASTASSAVTSAVLNQRRRGCSSEDPVTVAASPPPPPSLLNRHRSVWSHGRYHSEELEGGSVEQWQRSRRGGGEMARPLMGGEDAASQTT